MHNLDDFQDSSVTTAVFVDSITKGSSKKSMIMHLLQCLWFFSAHFDKTLSLPYSWWIEHDCRPALKKQILGIPTAKPSHLQHPYIHTNITVEAHPSSKV